MSDYACIRSSRRLLLPLSALLGVLLVTGAGVRAQDQDARVQRFLDDHRRNWRDLNIPMVDGETLHGLILERGYTRAYEIGTSTGHSTVWIAWALSKTGGRLITVEIDPRRQQQARENVAAAGLSDYVEFRLGDAHEITPQLTGEFDFVFSDADKDWYVQYFKDMYPKLTDDACFAAHNVRANARRGWTRDYLEHVRGMPDMETSVDERGGGLAISCKK